MLLIQSLCYKKAIEQSISHGRLPIGDYIKMASRHVLTVNQVLEIMLRWLEFQDWEMAFMSVIPKRKLPEAQKGKEDEISAERLDWQDLDGDEHGLEDLDTAKDGD
jgi:tRNA (guanine9-N1)-methyltransferase